MIKRKINTLSRLVQIRRQLRQAGKSVVLTNGCFDLLHPGHVEYLEAAKSCGDVLILALNGDRSVRSLKGSGRPILPERARAQVLAALESVDYICVFNAKRATGVMAALQPDVYAKGGDYTIATLNPEERAALEACGAKIRLLKLKPGFSTTSIVQKIKQLP